MKLTTPAPVPAPPTKKDAMMDIDSPAATTTAAEVSSLFLADVKQNVLLLEKAVAQFEKRFTIRVLRTTASLRKRWSAALLSQVIETHLPKDSQGPLLAALGSKPSNAMEVDNATVPATKSNAVPELEVYFRLLVSIWMLDQKQFDKGVAFTTETVSYVQRVNRRTMDALAASLYFYYARFCEILGKLQDARPLLLAAQRTSTLRHDDESLATLINLLLRNYLHYNLYDQADKLIAKSPFPEAAGNNQIARYMYYTGRIKAIQLDYTTAHRHLLQAIRKAPQSNVTAGFQQTTNKLFIIVQLLMGEIPERSVFRQATLRKSLIPYFHITQAVRIGDLAKFQDALAKYTNQFKLDKTYTLILRLRHNVIKTGVRMISLSYSRISLKDICLKLHLDSEEDAEFIVAKAIRDGVIDATIDHEHAFMKSKENADVYSSSEPQHAFHQRVQFCLNLHNESVKALRFPQSATKEEFETSKEIMEREREISDMVEEEMDEDDDDAGF